MSSTARDKARNWVFTINNFTEADEDFVIGLADDDDVQRIIAEHEHLFEGTPHIQGYISFYTPQWRVNVLTRLGGRAHLEPAMGGWKQNVAYCTKEKLVIVSKNCDEERDGVQNGKITIDVINAAKKMDPWAFEDMYPLVWFHHRNQVLNCMMDAALRRVSNWEGDLKTKNYWIWGEPGIGKSQWASSHMGVQWQYKKAVNKWWDGYNLVVHKIVILEDFPSSGQMFSQHIKIWSDRYFFMAECKGASMVVEPGRFFLIITSNFPIEACFENQQDVEAIQRRFTEFQVTRETLPILRAIDLNRNILKS